jgi:hypothetical protein
MELACPPEFGILASPPTPLSLLTQREGGFDAIALTGKRFSLLRRKRMILRKGAHNYA